MNLLMTEHEQTLERLHLKHVAQLETRIGELEAALREIWEAPALSEAQLAVMRVMTIEQRNGLATAEIVGDVTRGPCARCGTTTEQHGPACSTLQREGVEK